MLKRLSRYLFVFSLISVCLSFIAAFAFIALCDSGLEIDDEMLFEGAKGSSYLRFCAFDENGVQYEYARPTLSSEKLWYDITDISDNIKNAFISAEDREFYRHCGINFKRTSLALITHFSSRLGITKSSGGGSTITQQLIKNISGDNERTFRRKLNEMRRSRRIERNHTKDEILELYLNIIPLSSGINGVGLGSLTYFGKEPSELSVWESATIAGITNAPSRYNPFTHPGECLAKRNRVLYAMRSAGFINDEEYEYSVKQPLGVIEDYSRVREYDWFVETALRECVADIASAYDLSSSASRLMLQSGATVYLTVDKRVQDILTDYLSARENLPSEVDGGLDISFVVNDSQNGDLLGIIGSSGYKQGDRIYNRALAPLPVASVIKPLSVYSLALEKGIITSDSVLFDAPLRMLDDGSAYPRNANGAYDGYITVKDAIAFSKNTVAVELLEDIGEEYSFEHLSKALKIDTIGRELKINGQGYSDLGASSLALGEFTRGISLRRITDCYTLFPRGGVYSKGRSYFSVNDKNGNVLLSNNLKPDRVLSASTAKDMISLLSAVTEYGTARSVTLGQLVDTAGKTGTSSGDKCRIFVGFTPYYTAGVSIGYNGASRTIGNVSKSHLKIWDEIMIALHEMRITDDDNIKSFEI